MSEDEMNDIAGQKQLIHIDVFSANLILVFSVKRMMIKETLRCRSPSLEGRVGAGGGWRGRLTWRTTPQWMRYRFFS